MRKRSFNLGPLEVVVPVILAAVIGLVIFVAFAPGLGFGQASNANVVRIYTSVPMNNFASIVHGVEMALEDAGYRAGNFQVELVALNGAATVGGNWDAGVELANARRAVEDPDAMVYIGTYNSGAAKISIPILNRVNMAMISPGNTYPGLTKPGTGNAGEPWTYYPLGVRNYFRVVPADDLQGSAAVAFAQQRGVESVYVLDDTELYGKGIATIVAQAAREAGLEVKGGPESIDVRASDYTQLAERILDADPDLVYFGGYSYNHAGIVLRDLREIGYDGLFMGADGIQDNQFITDAGGGFESAGEVYSTAPGLSASQLSGPGADWYRRYKSRYPNDNNEDFAPFGYEAARVALHAIEQAGRKDREAIRAAVAVTSSADLPEPHILGDWTFDENGDTSLVSISVQDLQDGWTYRGLLVYNPETRTWEYTEGQ
ncbi:MAG: branched-chain amino acid ABC transporter substrate-binding protein [Chloroflexota bacterium]|nr:branched-chain amino acid ABC transporter substrate-binding protein [Chloroflexota bacterium]MDQ5867871.1 branched-chain amino acid ABC transporter substrate-binding protein [Chloroflexota bacterium]